MHFSGSCEKWLDGGDPSFAGCFLHNASKEPSRSRLSTVSHNSHHTCCLTFSASLATTVGCREQQQRDCSTPAFTDKRVLVSSSSALPRKNITMIQRWNVLESVLDLWEILPYENDDEWEQRGECYCIIDAPPRHTVMKYSGFIHKKADPPPIVF